MATRRAEQKENDFICKGQTITLKTDFENLTKKFAKYEVERSHSLEPKPQTRCGRQKSKLTPFLEQQMQTKLNKAMIQRVLTTAKQERENIDPSLSLNTSGMAQQRTSKLAYQNSGKKTAKTKKISNPCMTVYDSMTISREAKVPAWVKRQQSTLSDALDAYSSDMTSLKRGFVATRNS